jgi:S-adenosylmethionine:tRNA ribosyltransferase-isomerase
MIDFALPKELIAQSPASPRDSARLLVYERSTGVIVDTIFSELNSYLLPTTTLVLNNSKVEHCRLLFPNINAEIFLLKRISENESLAMVRPGKRFKIGVTIDLSKDISVKVMSIDPDGFRVLRFSCSIDDPRFDRYRHVPLPPYIAQNDALADEYQTVFADEVGSKAAPTAGLHFTKNLLETTRKQHDIAEITLHVGLGTFAPLTEKQKKSGKLHTEMYEIEKATSEQLQSATSITAVGTTSLRTLESVMNKSGSFVETKAETDIFIRPGYKFLAVDSLITNFHLPGTSLLLLVEAFIGSETETSRIYSHAIQNKYRFYSFGDAMLII